MFPGLSSFPEFPFSYEMSLRDTNPDDLPAAY